MPYKPVLLINDELKTGYKYGVALPDDSGVLVHRLNLDISPVDLKAVRDSIYNQEEFNFRRIVRQEGPTKAELACFRMILVFELPEELVNKIEKYECSDYNDAAISGLERGGQIDDDFVSIPPKSHLIGLTRGVFGFVHLVEAKLFKMILKAINPSCSKIIGVYNYQMNGKIVSMEAPRIEGIYSSA